MSDDAPDVDTLYLADGWHMLPGGNAVRAVDVVAVVRAEGREHAIVVLRNGTRVVTEAPVLDVLCRLRLLREGEPLGGPRPPILDPEER